MTFSSRFVPDALLGIRDIVVCRIRDLGLTKTSRSSAFVLDI